MNALSVVKQYLCQLHFSAAFQDLRLSWLIGSSRSGSNLSADCDSCREKGLCKKGKCLIYKIEIRSLIGDSGRQSISLELPIYVKKMLRRRCEY